MPSAGVAAGVVSASRHSCAVGLYLHGKTKAAALRAARTDERSVFRQPRPDFGLREELLRVLGRGHGRARVARRHSSEMAAAQEQLAAIYMSIGRFSQARAVLDPAPRYHEQNASGSPRDRGYCLATLAE